MIVEAIKLITSALPFIKEAFLWRDGAELGKPITKKNLIRRKIAVFLLLGSLILNYLFVDHLYKNYVKSVETEKTIAQLKKEREDLLKANDQLRLYSASCITLPQAMAICEDHIDKTTKRSKPKKSS